MLRFPRSRRLSLAILGLALTSAAGAHAQVLASNLLYTTLEPCRLVDTRLAGGPLAPGVSRTFNVVGVGAAGSLALHGGSPSGCPIPGFESFSRTPRVQALAVNLVAVGAAGAGNLVAWPTDQPRPATSVLNYASSAALHSLNLGNGVLLGVRQDTLGNDITVLAQVAGTDLVVDVVGYFSSGSPTQGSQNVLLGPGAGNAFATTASLNTALGQSALADNTTGGGNTAIGWAALAYDATGGFNTALGVESLVSNTAGLYNVAIGYYSGWQLANGDNNLYLASEGGGSSYESNTIRIGRPNPGTYNPMAHTATYIAGISGATSASGTAVLIDANGHLGTTTSSRRFKEEIRDMGEESYGLLALRPVTFRYKPEYDDGSRLLQYGLIAEEVAEHYPGLVQYDRNGAPAAIRYHFLDAMLLNEVQKQQRTITEQKFRLEDQAARIANLEARLARLEAERPPLR